MIKYQYQIVRYIHDRVTSEFVNVGVVIFQEDRKFIKSKFISKYSRISQFFSNFNGHHLIATLKQFEREIERISSTSSELFFEYKNITDITNSILPKDDSALECSEIFYSLDLNLDVALKDLFNRLVIKYITENDKEVIDDKHVWKNLYKNYFDKFEITKNLKSHSVVTNNDILEFDKSWKNGVWHCYQPISFDLKKVDSIKNKVYKWSGILSELENSNEELKIYFLTANSKKYKAINKFIIDTFTKRKNDKINVTLINENEAEKFAKSVSKKIREHIEE